MTDSNPRPGGRIIRFPVESVARLGFQRVRRRKRSRLEEAGQLNLFNSPRGEVLRLETGHGLFEEALALDERGDERAIERYERAISEGDGVADAYCNLGILRSRVGDTVAAFDCFTRSLELEPRHFEAHYNLGNLYFERGELPLAKLHYELAGGLEPDFPNVWFNLGLVEALNREFQAAIAALERFRSLVPSEEAQAAEPLLADLERSIAGKG